jgi:hypothetical protein
MSLHRRRLRQPALPSIGIGDMPPGVLAKILLGVATEFVPTYAAASYAQVCRLPATGGGVTKNTKRPPPSAIAPRYTHGHSIADSDCAHVPMEVGT